VARHNNGDRVPAVGQADGAHRRRVADPAGELSVGPGLAVGDLPQRRPDRALELRSGRGQRQVELREPSGKVGVELVSHRGKRLGLRVARRPDDLVARPVPLSVHIQASELAIRGHQRERADRAVDYNVRTHGLSYRGR